MATTVTFDSGVVSDDLYWGGTTDTPGTAVDRADATAGTTKALQFPDIADDEESFFEMFVTAAPGDDTLTVRYEVSSEGGYDFFRILVDGSDVLEPGEPGVSGTGGGWQEFTTSLSHGSRTLRFSYSKDSSADEGDDTTYISTITVPPIAPKPSVAAEVLADLTSSATGSTTIYPGYRFWKITCLATHSASGDTGLGEVELRGTIGGADLTDTETGVAGEDPSGPGDPATCFDNNTANYWSGSVEYASLLWTFETPQEVEQVHLDKGEMADLQVLYSYDNVTWATAALQRGLTGYSYTSTTPITVDLVGANRHYDGFIGTNDLAQTNVFNVWCSPDYLAVTGYYTPNPIRIEKLIAYSADQYPTPPIGMTTYTFAIKGVIYADDGGGYPGTLLAETAAKTSAPDGQWIELVLSAPVFVMPGTYWLGIHVGGDSGDYLMNNTVGAEACFTVARTYTSGVPGTFPGGGVDFASSRVGPIYAVYPISTGDNTLQDLVSNGGSEATGASGSAAETLAALVSTASGSAFTAVTGTSAETLAALVSTASGGLGFRHLVCLEASLGRTIRLQAEWVPK